MQKYSVIHLFPNEWLIDNEPPMYDERRIFQLREIWKKHRSLTDTKSKISDFFGFEPRVDDHVFVWDSRHACQVRVVPDKDDSIFMVGFKIDLFKFGKKGASQLNKLFYRLDCSIFCLQFQEIVMSGKDGEKRLFELYHRILSEVIS